MGEAVGNYFGADGRLVFQASEVGLSGEVRAVSMAEGRIREALKLGFTRCIMPAVNLRKLEVPEGIRIEGVRNVREAIQLLKN